MQILITLINIKVKPKKLVFVLPVTYQTQQAGTGIESLWEFYSDGGQPEKMAGLYPNRPSYVSFQASFSMTENKIWNSGKIRFKKTLQHSRRELGPRRSSVSPWNTVAQIPPWLRMVSCGAQEAITVVSWSQGGPHCSSRNNSFSYTLIPRLINYYLRLKFSHSSVPQQEHPYPHAHIQYSTSLVFHKLNPQILLYLFPSFLSNDHLHIYLSIFYLCVLFFTLPTPPIYRIKAPLGSLFDLFSNKFQTVFGLISALLSYNLFWFR